MSAIINTSKELLEKMNNSELFAEVVYGRYCREEEKEREENDAADVVLPRDRTWGMKSRADATKIQDNMFIITLYNYVAIGETVYAPVVDGKKVGYIYSTFDKALLAALAMKYNNKVEATPYAGMLLGINMDE